MVKEQDSSSGNSSVDPEKLGDSANPKIRSLHSSDNDYVHPPLMDEQSFDTSALIDEHIEEIAEDGRVVRRRGIFLLPNLFTSAALFAGFYAIVAAINGQFAAAGLAIFFGQLLDGVDGRVARLTNTQSRFGQEYDSLSDMMTFGLAPALVMFMWCLDGLGTTGWAVAFIYVAGAAVRLARFNAMADKADNRFFVGLASPPAATLVASTVWLLYDNGFTPDTLPMSLSVLLALQTALVGFLMVVNVRYTSFKGVNLEGRVPVFALLVLLLLLGAIAANPPLVLFIMAITYAVSGPLAAVWRKIRG